MKVMEKINPALFLRRVRESPRIHGMTHVSTGLAHAVYFGAVFAEGHGVYSSMGGVLLVLLVVSFVTGENNVE